MSAEPVIKYERFRFNECYEPVFHTKARYIDIWGGRAAGRSHFGTDYFLYLITDPAVYFRGCFLRNVYSDIRDSLFRDFKDRLENSTMFDEDDFEINETKMTIIYKPTGNMIISKGFRKSSGNRSGKLKSLAGLTHVLVEEADENSEHDVDKLDDSIRTNKIENIQIIFLHNPPSKNHWLIKRFYNLSTPIDQFGNPIEGYYKATPKHNPNVLCIHATYHSNIRHLNEKTIAKYESYGDQMSPFYNEEMYFIDVLGLVPEGARGRIYKNFKPITNKFFESLPYDSYYGLDFGYSDDPVALVEIKSHNNRNFWREIIYEPGLTNPALAVLMTVKGVNPRATIYADSSEPKSIQELRDLGFNVVAADKGADSVLFGIKQINSMENYMTEESANLWSENQEYKWHLDQNDEPTDQPVDKNNHGKDAGRYAITSRKQTSRKKKIVVGNTAHDMRNSNGTPSTKAALDQATKDKLDWV